MSFGRWPSPLSPETVAVARRTRAGLMSDGTWLYWLESRPSEGGRTVLVRAGTGPDRPARDVSPPGASLRSRVHEYGGGACCLVPVPAGRAADPVPEAAGHGAATGTTGPSIDLAYVDQDDQRVWLAGIDGGGGPSPRPLSAEPPASLSWRHGDLAATPDGRWILAVREEHAGRRVQRSVVAYATSGEGAGRPQGSGGTVLLGGRDFYAAPRPDATGRHLAWVCWDHPDMPWDASELWVAELDLGGDPPVRDGLTLAGGPGDGGTRAPGAGGTSGATSVGQPLWCSDGSLVFAWDAAGWWQPYRWRGAGTAPVRLYEEPAECHGPDWSLGQATMAELPGGGLAFRSRRDGTDALMVLRPDSGTPENLDQPCVSLSGLCRHGGGVAWLGATPEAPAAVWWWPGTGTTVRTWTHPEPPLLAASDVSVARHFSFRGRSGWEVHGLYYPPTLAGTAGPLGAAPPLVVTCHGGPTGSAEAGFDPVVQLLTTRGYAVAAVDYAGSTGYGRAYRERLFGRWGEADVDDCVDAARHLAARGLADATRMAVRGSSAGGLTALGALVRSNVFTAAVSWYGVTDLLALAAATHDFESRYTDRLVGPLPASEEDYRRRSPVNRVGDISGSVLVLQGLDDPVVPPAQAEAMVAALQSRGVECRYRAFPGESHGFRRAETLRECLEAELDFYTEQLAGP